MKNSLLQPLALAATLPACASAVEEGVVYRENPIVAVTEERVRADTRSQVGRCRLRDSREVAQGDLYNQNSDALLIVIIPGQERTRESDCTDTHAVNSGYKITWFNRNHRLLSHVMNVDTAWHSDRSRFRVGSMNSTEGFFCDTQGAQQNFQSVTCRDSRLTTVYRQTYTDYTICISANSPAIVAYRQGSEDIVWGVTEVCHALSGSANGSTVRYFSCPNRNTLCARMER